MKRKMASILIISSLCIIFLVGCGKKPVADFKTSFISKTEIINAKMASIDGNSNKFSYEVVKDSNSPDVYKFYVESPAGSGRFIQQEFDQAKTGIVWVTSNPHVQYKYKYFVGESSNKIFKDFKQDDMICKKSIPDVNIDGIQYAVSFDQYNNINFSSNGSDICFSTGSLASLKETGIKLSSIQQLYTSEGYTNRDTYDDMQFDSPTDSNGLQVTIYMPKDSVNVSAK